jgi:hypothetical protein
MPYTTGTCVGQSELLDALKVFLTTNTALVEASQNWALVEDIASPADGGGREVYFKGQGYSGDESIQIGFKMYDDGVTATDAHNIAVAGFTGHRVGVDFIYQPGYGAVYLTLTNQTMTYWFFANGRRVILVVRVGGVYVTAYAGLFLPYANPSAYPYPLFIGGNSTTKNKRYSTQDADNTNFFGQLSTSYRTAKYMYGAVWRDIYYGTVVDSIGTLSGYFLHQIMENGLPLALNEDGVTRYLTPLDIVCNLGFMGRLDGVMRTTGYGAVAEDTLTLQDGSIWLMIPNVYRNDTNHFAAFKLA